MLNTSSLEAVHARRIDPHHSIPMYGTYGFAQMPSLVRSLLTGAPTDMPPSVLGGLGAPKTVVLLLVDGFGWSFFERFADDLSFLGRIAGDGVVSKLTAQFPSSTAPHMTTLHTGAPVGDSGVLDWFYYEPAIDDIFAPLPCVAYGDRSPVADDLTSELYPTTSIYDVLGAEGVSSYLYQRARYADSRYSRAVTSGATRVPYRTLPEATVLLAERVSAATCREYHCLYVDVVDTISHRYGPGSAHVAAEIRALFRLFEEQLVRPLAGTDTLVLITADHGHAAVDPARTLQLGDEVPRLGDWMATNRAGHILAPAGGPRDLFLYVRPECVDEAYGALSHRLEGRASVHRVGRMVEAGYFGQVGPRLRDRLAPGVVLPHDDRLAWYGGNAAAKLETLGHHGGLTQDELEIPLLAWRP